MPDTVNVNGAAILANEVVHPQWGTGQAEAVKVLDGRNDGTAGWAINAGGEGAASVANGSDVAQGTTTDAAWAGTGAGTVVALLKAIWTNLRGGQATMANSLPVTIASNQSAIPAAATIADGSNVAQGAVADAAWSGSGSGTLVAVLKAIWTRLRGGQGTMANSLPVAIASDQGSLAIRSTRGTLTDRSGTITTGGTAQSLAASNASRSYLLVVNNDSANPLWINLTTTAVQAQPSIRIPPLGAFVMETGFVSTEAVSVIGSSTGQAFTAKEA